MRYTGQVTDSGVAKGGHGLLVIKTGNETGNETKSAYTLVEDNHYIMHSYTIIYARSTCLCIKQDSRSQISLHGAYRLEILNACSYPRVWGLYNRKVLCLGR